MKNNFENNNLTFLLMDLYHEMLSISGTEIVGLTIKINGFDSDYNVQEQYSIKKKINLELQRHNLQSIETVSNTFFPVNLWNPKQNRNFFYERYNKIIKKIKACPQNRYGIYFERMINYDENINQIDEIIKFYQSGNHRTSAMQIAIWDPTRDFKNTRMRGFPCMQQIVFSVVRNRLILFVFFATQYIFERAYGNFLGLCNLGKFMSHELDLPLREINCYIGVEKLNISKTQLREIVKKISEN